jgi:hypothetical protein
LPTKGIPIPIDPCLVEIGTNDFIANFSSGENTNTLNMRSNNQKGDDKVLRTNSEVKPWIHFDLGSVQKLKKIRFKPEVAANQQKSYFLMYSSKQPLDQSQSSVSYQSKSVTLNGTDNIELNDIEARYVKIQLNEEMPQSLVLKGVQFLVPCPPPNTSEDEKCTNGSFELGNFNGWNYETAVHIIDGSIAYGIPQGSTQGRFEILSLPYSDPIVPIGNACSGSYIARIGEPKVANTGVELLSYSISVDNSNSNLFFKYAVVLNVASENHTPQQQAYFEYQLFSLENGIKTKLPIGKKIIADENNPFFSKIGDIVYKNWTCENVNLSAYIGKTIIVEFTNADCSGGKHYAYTYIDGLCTSLKNNTPKSSISGALTVCSDSDYSFKGETSCGSTQFTWKLGETNWKSGVINEVSEDFFGLPSSINILEFYQKFGLILKEDKTYRLTLNVKNECGVEGVSTKDIYVNIRKKIDYKDLVICGSYPGSIAMQVNYNNCSDCTYQWSSFYKLDNPSSPFPTLKPQYALCDTKLKVYATDSKGCVTSDEVMIYPLKANFIELSKDVDMSTPRNQYCYYNINTKLVTECIPTQYLKLRLTTDADPNYEKFGDLTSNVSNAYNYNFKIPQSLGEKLINSSNRFKIDLMFDNNFVYVYGDYCLSTISTLENRYWYWGYFNNNSQYNQGFLQVNHINSTTSGTEPGIFLPELFNPSSLNIDNKQFRAYTKTGYGFGAFWRKAEIFDSWGGLVQSIEESAPLPTITLKNHFPDSHWIIWDGRIPGTRPEDEQFYPIGRYTWYINLENCSISERYQYVPKDWSGAVLLKN